MSNWVGFVTYFLFFYGSVLYIGLLYLSYYYNFYFFLILFSLAFYDVILRKPHKRPTLPLAASNRIFNWMLDGVIRYFNTGLHAKEKVVNELREFADSGKKFIFASHPHGSMALSSNILMNGSKKFAGLGLGKIKLLKLAASVLMKIPVTRHLALALGIISADRDVARAALDSEEFSIIIVIGGEYEQLLGQKDPNIIYVRRRRGFIRLALEHGNCVIVPTYSFGETETYSTFGWFMGLRMWIARKTRVALIMQWGRFFLPLMPKPVDINVVIGNPIEILPNEEMKIDEVVDEYHEKYITELENVYEEYKDQFGYGKRSLKFM